MAKVSPVTTHQQLAEDARQRVRAALRGRALKEAIAPAPPRAAANTYAAAMSRYSEAVAALVEKHILKDMPGPGHAYGPRLDDLMRDLAVLDQRFASSGRAAARAVARQGRSEVERMLNVSFRGTPGRAEGEAAFVEAFGRRQVQLLQSIGQAQVKLIGERLALGASADEVRQALWVSRNRAQMVAHNEVHALSTDVVGYWSREAGSKGYYWITSRDERVRHGHAVLDGKAFGWDNPPNTGRREGENHPGHAPNCRCRALPVEALEQ